MFSYLPEPLVAQTRNFFETEALLLPSQLEAKDDFLFLFRLHQDQTYTELDTLEELAECLDKFFFAGLLTGDDGGRAEKILRCLEFEQDIFAPAPPAGNPDSYGDVHASMPRGVSRLESYAPGEWAITISMDPNNQDGLPYPLHSLLETLVYATVNSWFKSFLCSCELCLTDRRRAAVLGPTQHGQLFVELLDSIARVIREWDPDLAAFYLHGDLVDL